MNGLRTSFFGELYGHVAIWSWIRRLRAWGIPSLFVGVFLLAYLLPFHAIPSGGPRLAVAGREALLLLQEYAREHVLLCLVPAMFIAGGVSVFVSQAAVMKYFGAGAHKVLAYGVASVSGAILAVCSCTILPLFAGIYTRGAGIGPATAFLYSGPAINVLAVMLTARVLGWELGAARAVGAILFSLLVGLTMHAIYRKEERAKAAGAMVMPQDDGSRPLWKSASYFAVMVGILVFANWAPGEPGTAWGAVSTGKWWVAGGLLILLLVMLWRWFSRTELKDWTASTWGFAKQILPLLFAGVLVAGLLLGRPGRPALIPESWIAWAVGGNSLWANLFASAAGALMYFATLTEVPILQGLLGAGMGKGPALALLLAGPALSLPNMLVIRSVMGTRKTVVYVLVVVVFSTVAGVAFGAMASG